jgi:hypothetical protein
VNYLVTKIHTSGLNSDTHGIVTLGARLLDNQFNVLGKLDDVFDPSGLVWQQEALDMHSTLLEYLVNSKASFRGNSEIVEDYYNLIPEDVSKVMFVSYSDFDYGFIKKYSTYNQLSKFYNPVLHIKDIVNYKVLDYRDLFPDLGFDSVSNVLGITKPISTYMDEVDSYVELFSKLFL